MAEKKTFTVWVMNSNGRGTCHVSNHEAEDMEKAKADALDETAQDWDLPPAAVAVLTVVGVASGVVELLEWNDFDE